MKRAIHIQTLGSVILVLLIATGSSGCADFDPASLVNKLRILAVQVDPAGAAPGSPVTLRPLIADPRGGGRSLTYEWASCITPGPPGSSGISALAPGTCAVAQEGVAVLGQSPSLDFTIPAQARELANMTELRDSTGALVIPVRLIVSAESELQRAIVSVAVTFESPPNKNPVLLDVQADGVIWSAERPIELELGQPVTLSARWDPASAETYSEIALGSDVVTERTESMRVSWFATAGKFDPEATSEGHLETTLKIEQAPPADLPLQLWAILDDGRGGVAFLSRRFTIRAQTAISP